MTRQRVRVARTTAQGLSNIGVRLEPMPGDTLPPFEAGAHIDVFLPDGLIRQYSIASAPFIKDHYELCIKREPRSRGGSLFIHEHLAEGDELEISQPRNLFTLKPAEHYVLIAAGIGITPLASMAAELFSKQLSFSLHYYTRTAADVAFRERLEMLYGKTHVHLHHSDAGRSPRQYLPEELSHPGPGQRVYLCGPSEFMNHVEDRVSQLGWAADCVHKEAFSAAPLVAQHNLGAFEIELKSTGAVYRIPKDRSIANVLIDAGVDVPVSCEQGMCGACIAGVLSGQPEHLDMVLSDAERALGNQMTLCCSRSLSARLVLDL